MFGLKKLLLLVVFAADQVLSRDTDYCYANDDKPYLKFATKTAYDIIRGGKTPYEPIPHCRPVQIWMLIRHGTRYPRGNVIERLKTLEDIRETIIENHESRGHGHLCDPDLDNLRMWHLDSALSQETADDLTAQGVEDMKLLGRRIKINFPDLFPPVISNVSSANYKFRSAKFDRIKTSQTAFMSGIFDEVVIPDAEIPVNDTLFNSYECCPGWKTEVADNPEVQTEVIKFTMGPEFQNLVSNVSRRLGFLDNMTVESIHNMWDMCGFEKAWNTSVLSPWCAVFSEEELKVLEYENILNDYYTRGYGHEYNIRLGCPPMQHLFQNFEKLESDSYSNEPKGIFNMARSGSLHLFMAAMGIAKDSTPLLASGYKSMNECQWSISEIGSFAANIAAVFYKCNGTVSPNKVMFYQSEKILPYEGCDGGLCDWEYLKNKFLNATSNCNADFCYPDSPLPQPHK